MASQIIRLLEVSDAVVIEKLKEVCVEIKPKKVTQVHLKLGEGVQKEAFSSFLEIDKKEDVQEIIKGNGRLLQQVSVDFAEQVPGVTQISFKRSKELGDHIEVSFTNAPWGEAAKCLGAISKHFDQYNPTENLDKTLGPELSEFYRKREQGLIRLEELTERLIGQNDEYRRSIDRETRDAQKALQDKYEKRCQDLENEHEQRLASLAERERGLEAKTKEIDDRSSRHARRQIRQDLKNAIAQRGKEFSLTPKTVRKRYVVHAVFLVLIGMLGGMVLLGIKGQQAAGQGAVQWYYLIKLPLTMLGTAAALIYYIRWNDTWFKRHADEEFDIKRFELDIDRASWIVEMSLEWKEAKGSEIPRELLDRLSANLFDHDVEAKPAQHPSEDMLGALLKASQELNLIIPGVGSIRLDRKGARQFQKVIDEKD